LLSSDSPSAVSISGSVRARPRKASSPGEEIREENMEQPTLEDVRRIYAALLGPMKPNEVGAELQKLRQEVQAWRKAHQVAGKPTQ
jgi:hypothetical protein